MKSKTENLKGKKNSTPPPNGKLLCLRCDWKWVPRKIEGRPARCPACSSGRWDVPTKKPNVCLCCNDKWVSHKSDSLPARCPKCCRTDWNNPQIKSIKPAALLKPKGK